MISRGCSSSVIEGENPGKGDPALRAALAAYLGRSRGLACRPEDILITAGAAQALDLIARATLSAGDAVGFEEPGYPVARWIIKAWGGRIVPVSVDEDGMQVEYLSQGDTAPLLVYTTPSHQYPLGTRLAVSRRLALLQLEVDRSQQHSEEEVDGKRGQEAAQAETEER